jgi:hypothetical protein
MCHNCENIDFNIDEFSDQLFNIERLMANYLDLLIAIGCDFNVDFPRTCVRMHASLQRSFCDGLMTNIYVLLLNTGPHSSVN